MCANRGKKRQNYDDYGSRRQPQSNGYSDYGHYAHHHGAEVYAGEGAGMSYGQQGGGQWSYDQSAQAGYYGLGTWGTGYSQGVYGHAGYEGVAYGGELHGYGHLHGGYSQQQISGSYDAQQHYNGGYSNYSQGDSVNGEQEGNVDSGYSSYSTRPDSGSYSNYRQGQNHKFHHQQSRGYASEARQRAGMPSDPTITAQSPRGSASPRRTPPPPPPPRRTEPTEEYLTTTQSPSSYVADPSSAARKLVVLDLNGSLLLRSAHQRRPPQPRYGHHSRDNGDPYADPTKLRPLRAVHRRPYLGAFTAFILHEKTKDWLDTMVWSSAQPHSVDDMVDRCFGERRSELRAVWARDTLGLAADAYHRKSLTLKDLEKPWVELPYYSTSPPVTASSPSEATETETPEAQHHSALSTVLVDDSPLKATLQPWNHLVIPEYLQQTRNLDLKVVEWEEAKERMEKTRRDIEVLESAMGEPAAAVETAIEEATLVVEADPSLHKTEHPNPSNDAPEATTGEGPSEQAAEGSEAPTAEGAFIPNPKRKKKKLAQKEKVRQEREAKEQAAFAALRERQQAMLAERLALAQASGQVPADVELPKQSTKKPMEAEVELKYDETLLAVVGVLNHLKRETNVSGWIRSGGLMNTALSGEAGAMDSSSSPLQPSTKHDVPGRGSSPSEHASPTKKRRIGSPPALETAIETASGENSSPIATEPPSSQITAVRSSPPPSEEQAETGVPLSAPVPTASATTEIVRSPGAKHTVPSTAGTAGLWYENEAVRNYWAEQGRKALAELDIGADSGMRTAHR